MNRNPSVLKLLRVIKGEPPRIMRARLRASISADAKRGIDTNPLVQANNRFVH